MPLARDRISRRAKYPIAAHHPPAVEDGGRAAGLLSVAIPYEGRVRESRIRPLDGRVGQGHDREALSRFPRRVFIPVASHNARRRGAVLHIAQVRRAVPRYGLRGARELLGSPTRRRPGIDTILFAIFGTNAKQSHEFPPRTRALAHRVGFDRTTGGIGIHGPDLRDRAEDDGRGDTDIFRDENYGDDVSLLPLGRDSDTPLRELAARDVGRGTVGDSHAVEDIRVLCRDFRGLRRRPRFALPARHSSRDDHVVLIEPFCFLLFMIPRVLHYSIEVQMSTNRGTSSTAIPPATMASLGSGVQLQCLSSEVCNEAAVSNSNVFLLKYAMIDNDTTANSQNHLRQKKEMQYGAFYLRLLPSQEADGGAVVSKWMGCALIFGKMLHYQTYVDVVESS